MIGVGDRVQLKVLAKAGDSAGPPLGSLGIVVAIRDTDDDGQPLALLVHFLDFDDRSSPDVDTGVWLVSIDEIVLVAPH